MPVFASISSSRAASKNQRERRQDVETAWEDHESSGTSPSWTTESDRIDDSDPAFRYSGGWEQVWSTSANYSQGGYHETSRSGASVRLAFNGTAIALFGSYGPDHGDFQVTLDEQSTTLSGYSPVEMTGQAIFHTQGLSQDVAHNLQLTNLDDGKRLDLDSCVVERYVGVGPSMKPSYTTSNPSIPTSPPPTSGSGGSSSGGGGSNVQPTGTDSISLSLTPSNIDTGVLPLPTSVTNDGSDSSDRAGVIAGSTIGSVAGLSLLLLLWYLHRRKGYPAFYLLGKKVGMGRVVVEKDNESPSERERTDSSHTDGARSVQEVTGVGTTRFLTFEEARAGGGGSFVPIRSPSRSSSPLQGSTPLHGRSSSVSSALSDLRYVSVAAGGGGGSGGPSRRESYSEDPYLERRSPVLSVRNPDVEPHEDAAMDNAVSAGVIGRSVLRKRSLPAITQAYIYDPPSTSEPSSPHRTTTTTPILYPSRVSKTPPPDLSSLSAQLPSSYTSPPSRTSYESNSYPRRPTLAAIRELSSYRSATSNTSDVLSTPASDENWGSGSSQEKLLPTVGSTSMEAGSSLGHLDGGASGSRNTQESQEHLHVPFAVSPDEIQYVGFGEFPFSSPGSNSQSGHSSH
ncbi:hypothetical protein BT69DRAFT_1279237 [Atractiella rhizophila]|nr:hypothetical protein BT69DRAFT_1279237 [Atractiella rhizophila]